MKGKIFSVLLTLCLLFTMIPTTVFAADVRDLTFFVVDEELDEPVSGAEGTVSVVRDGQIVATYELSETQQMTSWEEMFPAYTFQVDMSTLQDTDIFILSMECDGYVPIEGTVEDALDDDSYANLGPVEYWKLDETVPEDYGTSITPCCTIGEDGDGFYVSYDRGPWNEELFLEKFAEAEEAGEVTSFSIGYPYAMDYAGQEGFGIPKLSAKFMSTVTKSSPYMDYCFDGKNRGWVAFETIKGTTEFGIDLTTELSAAAKKRFEEENITTNYMTMNITGDAVFTGAYFEIDMSEEFAGIFTVPEENIQISDGFEAGSTYVQIVKYNSEKNDFDSCGYGIFTYETGDFADGEPVYALVIEPDEVYGDRITGAGSYIIIAEDLPLHMYFGDEVIDDINASMTTEEVSNKVIDTIVNNEPGNGVKVELPKAMNIGADAMQKAKDTETPITVAVVKTADSSYVNWSFAKIDNAVEFNPAVHVDATVEAVDTKLAAVELPSTLKMTTVSFEFDGTLPGEANVTLDMKNSDLAIENTAEGTVVYLYYYNPTTNLFELQDEAAVTNGLVTFKMTHCSDYVVTSEKLPSAATTQQTPPVDNNPPAGDPPTQTPPAETPSGEAKPEQTPTTYPVLEGANNEWTQGTTEGMTVRVDADFAKFNAVKVNDTVVDAKYYTAVSGSTIITLKQEYLDTLTEGTYKITIVFTDGECSTNFEIKKAVETTPDSEEDKDNTQQNTTTTPPVTNGAAESPETIDNGIFYVAMFFMIGAAVVGISAFRRKQTK